MSAFRYQPLDKGVFSVHLVSILPGTGDEPLALEIKYTIISEQSPPDYMALSYTLGTANDKLEVPRHPLQREQRLKCSTRHIQAIPGALLVTRVVR